MDKVWPGPAVEKSITSSVARLNMHAVDDGGGIGRKHMLISEARPAADLEKA